MEYQNGGDIHRAHVLVLPFPAQGHINPMLQFSKRLVSKGVRVTFVTTVFLSKSMHGDPQSSIEMATISDGFDNGGINEAETNEAYVQRFQEVGPRTLAELIKKLQDIGHPVQALVYDPTLTWAFDVAKDFGLLKVVFFTQTCAVNSVYYHVNKSLLQLPLSVPHVSLPGLPRLKPTELPSFVYNFGSYPTFLEVLINQFSNIDNADLVLFNIFYDLEKEIVDWMSKRWNLKTVGPTVPSMYLDKRLQNDKNYGLNFFEPKISACTNWLKDKPSKSVVYVSFGSLAELNSEQMEEIAWGLKRSDYYFLWVVRASEEEKLSQKIKNEISEKGLVVSWCFQLEVLSHESVGCFVTHCGFNSVLEALSIGVPLVAMPIWTDQPTNAKYVEDVWRIGVRVGEMDEKGIVRREAIERCIKEVMEGEKKSNEIKKNAIKWRDLAIQAVDEGGSSDKNIIEFVAALDLLLSQFLLQSHTHI